MIDNINDHDVVSRCGKIEKVVSVPISLSKSLQGRYYVGQTETLMLGNGCSSWAGLFNPCNSGVNLFANVLTISNFSDQSITAEKGYCCFWVVGESSVLERIGSKKHC